MVRAGGQNGPALECHEDESEGSSHALARNAAVVSGATLLSRLLGFARDCLIAAVLGAGPLADAFFIALRLPNLMRRLFGEGSLSLALISEFAYLRGQRGLSAAYAMVRACLFWLVCLLGVLSAGAWLGAVPLTSVLAPGFGQTPALLARTAELVRLCFPYAVLICATALCGGVLQAGGHFLAPALAPSIFNLCLIAGAGVAWLSGWPVPETLAAALLIAGVLQFALQQPFLWRQGFRWRGPWSPLDSGARRVGTQMLPAVFGAAVYQLSVVLTTMLASFLPQGSISHLYYADRLVQFPLGVFGIAVGTAALPALAALAAKGDSVEFCHTLCRSLRLTLFISLPAAAGLAGMALPVVTVLFGRGAFGGADVLATTCALWGYAPGLPAFAAVRPLLAAFHSLRDARTPVVAAIVGLVVTLGSGAVLMWSLGPAGLALAVSAGSWANVLTLHYLLGRREPRYVAEMRSEMRWVWRYALLSAAVLGGAWACAVYWVGLAALAGIPLIIVAYWGGAMMIGSPDIQLLLAVRRKRGRSQDRS